jgi:dTDP-4-amino-4,6-dideoxygalactose transaminase
MNPKIWLSSPHMGEMESYYVQEAFASNWIAPMGPHVNSFEEGLGNFLQEDVQVAALSSGTAALHLALIILGVKAGDEVICQSMTFCASANPIVYQGAIPVFVDSEESTWNMSPQFLELAIQDRMWRGKKPKAIIVVHLYGMPARIDEILEIAQRYEIPVIEDAAEALGSTFYGQQVGTFGDMGIFSFNGNKIITTSGGGALVSADAEYIKKARFLASQALDAAPHYQHSQIGYNYRMSNVCAGIGRGQLEVLPERVLQRRSNFAFYKKALATIPEIRCAESPAPGYYSNHWLSVILVDSHRFTREDIRLLLVEDNIDCRPLWKPMHLQPVFSGSPYYGNGTSDRLFEKGLCLPSGSNLTAKELNRVVDRIYTAADMTWSATGYTNNIYSQ